MTSQLQIYIQTPENYDQMVQSFDAHLKAQEFVTLDKYLRDCLAHETSEVAKICREIPLGSVRFPQSAWEALHRDIVKYEGQGKDIAAIGFDLTGHWEGEGPGFEVSFYRNHISQDFSFGWKSHRDLLSVSKYPTPWQGCFLECHSFGPITGLEPLYEALYNNRAVTEWRPSQYQNGTAEYQPEDHAARFLGLFFLINQVQECFARELQDYGLPKALPVLLGTHDFLGTYDGYNVVMSEKIARLSADYETIRAEDAIIALQRAKDYAAEQIEQYTYNWMALRNWNRKSEKGRETASNFEDMIMARMKLAGLNPVKPISDMDQAEFKSLMESYYRQRMARQRAS